MVHPPPGDTPDPVGVTSTTHTTTTSTGTDPVEVRARPSWGQIALAAGLVLALLLFLLWLNAVKFHIGLTNETARPPGTTALTDNTAPTTPATSSSTSSAPVTSTTASAPVVPPAAACSNPVTPPIGNYKIYLPIKAPAGDPEAIAQAQGFRGSDLTGIELYGGFASATATNAQLDANSCNGLNSIIEADEAIAHYGLTDHLKGWLNAVRNHPNVQYFSVSHSFGGKEISPEEVSRRVAFIKSVVGRLVICHVYNQSTEDLQQYVGCLHEIDFLPSVKDKWPVSDYTEVGQRAVTLDTDHAVVGVKAFAYGGGGAPSPADVRNYVHLVNASGGHYKVRFINLYWEGGSAGAVPQLRARATAVKSELALAA